MSLLVVFVVVNRKSLLYSHTQYTQARISRPLAIEAK